jgi:hypothetical protein
VAADADGAEGVTATNAAGNSAAIMADNMEGNMEDSTADRIIRPSKITRRAPIAITNAHSDPLHHYHRLVKRR